MAKNEKKDQDMERIKFEIGQEMGISGPTKSKPPEKDKKIHENTSSI